MGSNGLCVADKSTEDLLHSFRNGGGEAAFEEIVRRYAGMVYSVCLQVTRDVHDAEDATQAAFLTLALRAKTAENIRYLGPWLQKVARRLSLDIMRAKKRRKKREERRGEMIRQLQPIGDPRNGLDRLELADIVRDELGKLPAKYRLPLILHYFGGLRPEEVARELGFKPSTLGVRLHRGRKMLADSLAERGITLSSTMLGAVLAGIVHTGVSDNLIAQASLAAAGLTSNGELPAAVISARVLSLTRHAAAATIWAKVKATIALMTISSVALAGGVQAVRAYVPQAFDREFWDVTRFIRPLMRSLMRPPQMQWNLPMSQAARGSESGQFGHELTLASWIAPPPPQDAGAVAWSDSATLAGASLRLEGSPGTGAVSEPAVLAEFTGSASLSLANAGALPPDEVVSPFDTVVLPAIALPQPSEHEASSGYTIDARSRTALHQYGVQRFNDLTLDSRSGPLDRYVMSGPAQVFTQTLTVGKHGVGQFVQQNGSVHVSGDLVLGLHPGSHGTYYLEGESRLVSANQQIGLGGSGLFVQEGGQNRASSVNLGVRSGSSGQYVLNDGTLQSEQINIGVNGDGTFTQGGGDVVAGTDAKPGSLVVGVNPQGEGVYVMDGGRLTADKLAVGQSGKGTFIQDGGLSSVRDVHLGVNLGAQGTLIVSRGGMQIRPSGSVVVGGGGEGSVILGNSRHTGIIYEEPPDSGATLRIREQATGRGEFRGWGEVFITGPIVQNGLVTAYGFGQSRELDFSSASYVTNTIDNPEEGGRNGWYAQRGGKLVLPAIHVHGDSTSTWGEDPNDPVPDLVNSVRFTLRDVSTPGKVILSLLANDYEHVPRLPEGEEFIGIWSFDRRELDFARGNIMVRYDDVLVEQLGGDEMDLRLWTYADGWEMVPLTWTVHDPLFNLIAGRIGGDLRLFGVALPTQLGEHRDLAPVPQAVPEPTSLLGAMLLGTTLLRRRRRA